MDRSILHLKMWSAPGGSDTIAIPNDAALAGLQACLQTFWTSTTGRVDSSNGVVLHLGR